MGSSVVYAYAAGVIDGEGCISSALEPNGGKYRVQVAVSQREPEVIAWLATTLGGKVWTCNTRTRRLWKVTPRHEVRELLTNVLPYLTLKKPQAELAIEMSLLPPIERQHEIHLELQRLKRSTWK